MSQKQYIFVPNNNINLKIRRQSSKLNKDYISILKKYYHWTKHWFYETYYDDEEYTLYKNNCWLRRIDKDKWCLEIAKIRNNGVHIEEIVDIESIKTYLKKIVKCENDGNTILDYCPICVATLVINRWTMDKDGYEFHMDSCLIKNDCFYNIISYSYEGSPDRILLDCVGSQEDNVMITRNKILKYIYENDMPLYETLKTFCGPLPDHVEDSISDTCLFPSGFFESKNGGDIANVTM